jgi:hypothetical protein
VFVSNLDEDNCYYDVFLGFPQALHAHVVAEHRSVHDRFLPNPVPFHYPSSTLRTDANNGAKEHPVRQRRLPGHYGVNPQEYQSTGIPDDKIAHLQRPQKQHTDILIVVDSCGAIKPPHSLVILFQESRIDG